jgi:hypothetical protein
MGSLQRDHALPPFWWNRNSPWYPTYKYLTIFKCCHIDSFIFIIIH